MAEPRYRPTERTRVQRKRERGHYERALVDEILDEALICHVGVVHDGLPVVIPTIHARLGERLYLHGSPGSATLGALVEGAECCVTATLVDGIVLARAARKHSLNYRSVVLFGTAAEVTDPDEREAAVEAIVEHIVPGRARDARAPTESELASTRLVSLPLEEVSAKVREGGPADSPGDLELGIWAGQIPLAVSPGEPLPDEDEPPPVEAPDYVRRWPAG